MHSIFTITKVIISYICNMGIKLNIRQGISSSIIFSGLGIFSHYLLINSELFLGGKEVNITSPISYAYIIIAFNIVGFTIISLSHWTESIRFPNALRKARLPIVYLMAAIILLRSEERRVGKEC